MSYLDKLKDYNSLSEPERDELNANLAKAVRSALQMAQKRVAEKEAKRQENEESNRGTKPE